MTNGDTGIDRLYQLPLDEFTAARNALAKGSKQAAAIKALTKPPVAAWAVNQLYWRNRRAWDTLIAAAENQRLTHKAMLSGREGDVRAAGKVHDEAVQDALKATLDILSRDGHAVTDATKQAVVTTLRALPSDEPPGRLTRVLQPGGFEMLAGFAIAGRAPATSPAARTADIAPLKKDHKNEKTTTDVKALTQARQAAAAAEQAVKDAEQAVRRHEFEIARATRDEERAEKSVRDAREALEEAKTAMKTAERELADAVNRRERAEEAAKTAASALKKLGVGL